MKLHHHRRLPRISSPRSDGKAWVLPIRPSKLLWLPAGALLMWSVQSYGTPHLRYEYDYTGTDARPYYTRCLYIGWHTATIYPRHGHCPLFIFRKGT